MAKTKGALPVVRIPQSQDHLVLEIGEWLDGCADELGVDGCAKCPVRGQCKTVWREIENHTLNNLTLREYRRYSMKLYMLKQERDSVLKRQGRLRRGRTM